MKLYGSSQSISEDAPDSFTGACFSHAWTAKNRYPDLTVLRPEHPDQIKALGQAAITLEMAPPRLVLEVVRPGADNHRRDYIDKRNQYEWRGVPEYWIVDQVKEQVTVLFLTQDGYEETVFVGDKSVKSPSFED